jgi:hypothetical protein
MNLHVERLTWGQWAWWLTDNRGIEHGHGICATESGAYRVGRQVASRLLVNVW